MKIALISRHPERDLRTQGISGPHWKATLLEYYYNSILFSKANEQTKDIGNSTDQSYTSYNLFKKEARSK